MEPSFLFEILLFTAKFVIVLILLFLLIMLVAALLRPKARGGRKNQLKINSWNKELEGMKLKVVKEIMNKKTFKKWLKEHKKDKSKINKNNLFVLSFNGDIKASATETFKKEISLISTLVSKNDKVLLKINSRGGAVTGYGQAAFEFARLKNKEVELIASVDQVAASGGYLLAAVADKIYAAPLAIVGSIGVAAEVPNLHNFLKNKGIDYDVHTAGKYKRTLSLFGKNTKEGAIKFQQDLNTTHKYFKEIVAQFRPNLKIDKVADGSWFYGKEAIKLNLIDGLKTSEEFIQDMSGDYEILNLAIQNKPSVAERFSNGINLLIKNVVKNINLKPFI